MRQLFTKENIITSGKRLKLRSGYIKKVVKIVVVWLFNCPIKCVLNLLRNIKQVYMKKILFIMNKAKRGKILFT